MGFNELLKKLTPTLRRIIYRLHARDSFFNDDDLYQEAVLRLWKDFCSHKLEGKTDSYILQGCYFHLKNYMRTARDKRRVVSIDACVPGDQEEHREGGFFLVDERSLNYRDNLHVVLLAQTILNNGFTTKEKDILNYYAQGLTTRQIGSRLGVSHVRIVKMMGMIRQKCRQYLDA